MWLAKQGLAFRGHAENEQAKNRGNFLELCEFRAQTDQSLKIFLNQQFNYTHHDIQQELVHIIANNIRQLNLPGPNDYWSMIADETTDFSNIEQLTFVIRSVDDNLVISERFFGFWSVPDTCSATLFKQVKAIVYEYGLNAQHLVATGFDGAANMIGSKSGLCTLIKNNLSSKSIYIHCYCHKLNLALESACTRNEAVLEVINLVKALHSYVEGSAKRHHPFQNLQDEATTTLKRLCYR